ncbi:hypothetical protein FKM82_021343 [Ascaphus truei]
MLRLLAGLSPGTCYPFDVYFFIMSICTIPFHLKVPHGHLFPVKCTTASSLGYHGNHISPPFSNCSSIVSLHVRSLLGCPSFCQSH